MVCQEPALFYQELKTAVAEYFNDAPAEERRTFRMFLVTLYGIVDVLERSQNAPQSIARQMSLDGLSSLSVNLAGAVQLVGLIKDYQEALKKGLKSDAQGILVELEELVKFCHDNLARE